MQKPWRRRRPIALSNLLVWSNKWKIDYLHPIPIFDTSHHIPHIWCRQQFWKTTLSPELCLGRWRNIVISISLHEWNIYGVKLRCVCVCRMKWNLNLWNVFAKVYCQLLLCVFHVGSISHVDQMVLNFVCPFISALRYCIRIHSILHAILVLVRAPAVPEWPGWHNESEWTHSVLSTSSTHRDNECTPKFESPMGLINSYLKCSYVRLKLIALVTQYLCSTLFIDNLCISFSSLWENC